MKNMNGSYMNAGEDAAVMSLAGLTILLEIIERLILALALRGLLNAEEIMEISHIADWPVSKDQSPHG